MTLSELFVKCKSRVTEVENLINQSATNYNTKDQELKQLLANHNVLLGSLEEVKNIVVSLEALKKEYDSLEESSTTQ